MVDVEGVIIVSIIGIGSDQISKVTQSQYGVHAYHANEHKGPAAILLCQRILSVGKYDMENSTILLYISLQLFDKKEWRQFFGNLSES